MKLLLLLRSNDELKLSLRQSAYSVQLGLTEYRPEGLPHLENSERGNDTTIRRD